MSKAFSTVLVEASVKEALESIKDGKTFSATITDMIQLQKQQSDSQELFTRDEII